MNVAGKPILAYILDELRSLGVEEIVLVVGHLAEKIRGSSDGAAFRWPLR
jgi:NDP-sugar pyrophosphorylase family protein